MCPNPFLSHVILREDCREELVFILSAGGCLYPHNVSPVASCAKQDVTQGGEKFLICGGGGGVQGGAALTLFLVGERVGGISAAFQKKPCRWRTGACL